MFHRWAALGLVLALWAMSPKNAAGQGSSTLPRGPSAGARVPYPNPFNPEIHIPFVVGDSNCASTSVGQQHEVSILVRNVLGQVVAYPVLLSASPFATVTSSVSAGSQTPINRVRLTCGNYTAFWDGFLSTKKEAASGTYVVLVYEDGKVKQSWRIFNRK